MKPGLAFYRREAVTDVARALLGKILMSDLSGKTMRGIIVETEAYSFQERGCHAFGNRMTNRNKTMFEAGGVVYIYQCYGIHHLLNIVTGSEGRAEAVLIRALQPVSPEDMPDPSATLAKARTWYSGPGRLTRTLGIHTRNNGLRLGHEIQIVNGVAVAARNVVSGPRIGIDYAGSDATLPWRFYIRNNGWVSR